MAFKMAPKSPVLMKAMGYSSPAKQRSGGISSEENMEPAQERRMNKELRLIKKKKAPTPSTEVAKEETAKEVKEKVLTPKEKALQKLQEAQSDNEVSNIEKQTSKVKKNSTKKRKQAKRKESQAERRTEKTKRLEERIQRRKSRRSPAKQRTGGHGITKKTPELGNKNAEIGADGKMTIIEANMAKNQKPLELKKMKHKKMKMEKIELKKNNSSR